MLQTAGIDYTIARRSHSGALLATSRLLRPVQVRRPGFVGRYRELMMGLSFIAAIYQPALSW